MKHSSALLLLLLGTCSAYNYQNVALRGKATQSHQADSAYASAYNAIDGNREPTFGAGSCSHSIAQTNPWWRVDLLESYIVTSVIITNRDDCCAEYINGAEVHIGNSLQDDGAANPVVGVIPEIPLGRSLRMTFTRRVEGRYVTVVLPGPGRQLVLCEVEVYGYRAPGENLALQGKATQSSQYSFATAYNAIDGNRASNWDQASCSCTNNNISPWWRLDLGKTHKVFSVNITNRDAYPERLNGAEIRIGDSLRNNGNENPRCAVISHIYAGFTETFQCNGMDGRYINIVIPGRREYLTLCEVEVYGSRLMMKLSVFLLLLLEWTSSASTYQNVALRGKATQSDRYEHMFGSASNAIDGNRDSTFGSGSCTHTDEHTNPWWRVDLLDTYIINSVIITNRGDCCEHRINGLRIHIGNSLQNNGLSNPVVGMIPIMGAGESDTLNFTNRVEGRYVTLVLPGLKKMLTVCEVEVYGYRAPTGENLAVQGKATQSSLYSFGIAYNAIDGNRASNWDQGSCIHTKNEIGPWWRLDLGKTHKVFSVNVTNRDENPERLHGAEIRIGDSLENNGNNNTRCAVITSIPAGAVAEFQCDGIDGRYVNVVIPDREEFLSLCEVEVYGSRLDVNSAKFCHLSSISLPPEGLHQSVTCSLNSINNSLFPVSTRTMKHSALCLLLLILWTCSAYSYQNVALRGKATQSHRFEGLRDVFTAAYNAIDGNRQSTFSAGSCSQTITQTNPWWRVDLLESYIVTSVIITNRGDCCAERINGAEIHIGNSLQDNGAANPVAGVISTIPAGSSHTLTFSSRVEGRYVTVRLPGTERILTLCEVEVYGYRAPTGENLALQGKATQASLFGFGIAYNAIDGNRAPKWEDASCTQTDYILNPWWRLDLRKTHKVFSVKIVNRDFFSERLNGAEIRIGDSLDNNGNNNPRCAVITHIPASAIVEFPCNGLDGRYVNVLIPGRREYLSLCEVEVYGSVLD
ncbi:uncharacterized protein [Trachinotus anak]|uniref:uncharacterized protein n=1 Tax=Trachinotus anak TaxID=443729 RepID=UPI0039F232AA